MTDEVIVGTAADEIQAEIIAGRLRAEGIRARVRFESQAGIPRQLAPSGSGYGLGGFRIAVPATEADAARALLSGDEPAVTGRHPVLRAVAILVLVSFVLALVPGLVDLLQAIFGSR
ncbi:MAG TPA: DUF2007 domain-containing protein [Candidatus Saccharimonadales bacterium]|nr:DUF2007 domain-containing protein [Candidatus Saccharimonadales bacterium]